MLPPVIGELAVATKLTTDSVCNPAAGTGFAATPVTTGADPVVVATVTKTGAEVVCSELVSVTRAVICCAAPICATVGVQAKV